MVQSLAWYFYFAAHAFVSTDAVNGGINAKRERDGPSIYSQHSRARRAHEAAHRDVRVCDPGLVALEAVFVYSRLGQLADLTRANLLVVPVLAVRHFFFFFWQLLRVSPCARTWNPLSPLSCPPPLPVSSSSSPRLLQAPLLHARIVETRSCGCTSDERLHTGGAAEVRQGVQDGNRKNITDSCSK